MQNNGKEMYKKVCRTCKVVIINRCLHPFFNITQFYIFDIKESFVMSEKHVKSTKQTFNVIVRDGEGKTGDNKARKRDKWP